jgi:zinc transport system ATP-binding protein
MFKENLLKVARTVIFFIIHYYNGKGASFTKTIQSCILPMDKTESFLINSIETTSEVVDRLRKTRTFPCSTRKWFFLDYLFIGGIHLMCKVENNETIIDIRSLSFHYGTKSVLENINLQVKKGSFLGLVGPNGSGKSTLIKCILGLLEPSKGEITLFDQPINKFKHWEKIGFVSQKANSFNSGFPATVFEVVSMGLFGKIGLFRFLTKQHKAKVREAIELVGMTDYLKQNIGELSGGQQQRVFIARALVSDPELLILDEPTVGVDIHSANNFYAMLSELNKKGITLLLVTHDVSAMTENVTAVACLNKQLHFHGNTKDFQENHGLSAFHGQEVHLLVHNHGRGGK